MRLLIVDDHELIRRGIRSLLSDQPAYEICGEAVDGRDALDKARELKPDLIVMDVSMPRLDGLEATRHVRNLLPDCDVLIVSQHDASEMARQAFQAGACGYVVKSSLARDLISAIETVSRGDHFFDPAIIDKSSSTHADVQEILQRSIAFEKALKESERRLRSLVQYQSAVMNNMAEGLYALDANGLLTSLNRAGEAMLGWTKDELLGKKMHDLTHYKHPDGSPYPASDCVGLRVVQHGIALYEYEDAFIRKDGSFVPVVYTASPLKEGGKITGVIVSFRDDTEQRLAREALLQAKRELEITTSHLQMVTRSMAAAVTRCSRDFRYLWANQSYADWIQRPLEEIIGKRIVDVLGKDGFDRLLPHFERVLSGERVSYEERAEFAGIGSRWISGVYTPTFDAAGTVDGWIAVVCDTTERNVREAERRRSEERFHAFFESSAIGAVRADVPSARLLDVNDTFCRMTGYSREELQKLTVFDITHPADRKMTLEAIENLRNNAASTFTTEKRYVKKDGASFWAHTAVNLVPASHGESAYVVAVINDINDRKLMGAELEAEANALAKLNACSSRLWQMRSLQSGLVEMLSATIELLGADKGNVQLLDPDRGVLTIAAQRGLGKEFLEFFREVSMDYDSACGRALRERLRVVIEDVENDAAYAPYRHVARATGYRAVVSTPLIGRDGVPLGMLSVHFAAPHRPSNQDLRRLDLYVAQASYFIERCKMDEQLRRSEERLRLAQQVARIGVWDWDLTSRRLSWSPEMEAIYGYTPGGVREHEQFRARVHPEDLSRIESEREIAVRDGKPFDCQFRIVLPSGEIRWITSTGRAFYDKSGQALRILGINIDETERRQAETRLQESAERFRSLSARLDSEVRARTMELETKNADLLRQSEQVRELSQHLLHAQEEERRRIARELHDNAGQTLAVISMNVAQVLQEANGSPQIAKQASEIQALVEQLDREIRTTSYLLHPPLLDDGGLPAALKWYMRGLAQRSDLCVTLEVPEDFGRLPSDMELVIFRLIQESMTNIHRHSGSKTALIRIRRDAENVQIEIRDQGRGISPERLAEVQAGASGLGIRGMQERLGQFRGEMKIESDGRGACVAARIPLPKKVPSANGESLPVNP